MYFSLIDVQEYHEIDFIGPRLIIQNKKAHANIIFTCS